MKIYNVQSYNLQTFAPIHYAERKKAESDKYAQDEFISNKGNISFTAFNPGYKHHLRNFLTMSALRTSIKASRIIFFALDKDLARIAKPVKIKVNDLEEINAFDINPKKSNKYIIFLHGFAQNITNNQALYKALSKTDYGVLVIDYRGYGKNQSSIHISENDLVEDVIAGKKYLKDKNVKQIGLIGHSFGTYLSEKVSKYHDFAFQVLISPTVSLNFWVENVLKNPKKYKYENFLIRHIPFLKAQYEQVFRIQEYITGNKTPTYIIHSIHDKYCHKKDIASAFENTPEVKACTFISNGGHRLDDEKVKEIVNIVNNL